MNIKLQVPDLQELKPRITVIGVGGAGGNAVNNMIESGLTGVEFVAANTDAQALTMSAAETRIQMGTETTEGLGAGSKPEVGREAAEEAKDELRSRLKDTHMVFVAAGMGGGTGTGAAPVVAQIAKEEGVLTVGVVTKPFHFEGHRRMQLAEQGIEELRKHVDTLIVIPNQNLFRVATDRTTFAESFKLADRVLHAGISCITDLMLKEGLVNLDFADVKTIMDGMGTAVMGTGHATGENRAIEAAQEAINNQLLDDITLHGAKGLLISVTGGDDLTLFDVDAACTRIREEVEPDANVIFGAIFDENLTGQIRVSIVASGIERSEMNKNPVPPLKHTMQNRVQQIADAPQTRVPPTPARPTVAAKQPRATETPSNQPEKTAQPGVRVNTNPRQQQGRQTTQPQQQKAQRVATQKMPPLPPQAPRPDQQSTVQTTDGVQIDYGLPNLSPNAVQKTAAAPRQQAAQRQNMDGVATAPGFTPQPPMQAPRSSSRIPTPDEFPPHIQHEIHPEIGEPEPRGINQQKKKIGFLERLSAVTKGAFLDDSSKTDAPTAPQYPQEPQAFPENSQPMHTDEQPVHSYGDNAHTHQETPVSQPPSSYDVREQVREEREDIDIPPFLRKGRG